MSTLEAWKQAQREKANEDQPFYTQSPGDMLSLLAYEVIHVPALTGSDNVDRAQLLAELLRQRLDYIEQNRIFSNLESIFAQPEVVLPYQSAVQLIQEDTTE
mgnify:CR=1 FL=1